MIAGLHRREALKLGAVAAAALSSSAPGSAFARDAPSAAWVQEPMRWFQLSFTEDDPGHYDQAFWLDYFRQIHVDGVCLSAGGGIAFYPTRIADHGRARGLAADADPFGDMVAACKAMGLRVLARIDPHAMNADVAARHPDWALTGLDGKIQKHGSAPDLTLTCPYGPYNFDLMLRVIAEIARRYPVDGFFGNRWSGSGMCYCASCKSLYRAASGQDLPANPDPSTPAGRQYAAWVQQRLFQVMDLWTATARRYRHDAFFVPGADRRGLVDLDGRGLFDRLPLAFGDRQARSVEDSLWATGPEAWGAGRFVKGLHAFMRDKPVGQIISVGVEEAYRWKDSVQDAAEIRVWAAGTIAHGARPWVTKFNAKPIDKRWMEPVRDIFSWHHANERYLRNTANLAQVALVVSSRTAPYLGGWKDRQSIEGHGTGFYRALLESRVPFDMVDDAFLDAANLARYRTLVLANAAVLSDAQCAQLRAFVARGGNIVATHQTSLYDEQGRRRSDFALADLFGCSVTGAVEGPLRNAYLTVRDHPALASLRGVPRIIGPIQRLPIRAHDEADVVLTLVPPYPDLPMERLYTPPSSGDLPMAICRSVGAGRVAYLAMDIDRTFGEIGHGDHLRLLAGMVQWAHGAAQPMQVEGPGLVDIAYWRQAGSVAAHLVNLNNPMTMRGSYREVVPAGPYRVTLALPGGARPTRVRLLETGVDADHTLDGNRLTVTLPQIRMHEVVAVDLA